MTRIKLFYSKSTYLRKWGKCLLAFSWILGLLCGITAAWNASAYIVPMVRSAAKGPASTFGLFSAALLPFLVSTYAVSISEPWLLLIISTFKAFGFGFSALAVSLAFGQSGWLVRFLFLFSDHLLIPLLYLYWLRHISMEREFSRTEMIGCIIAAVIVGMIDYLLVSPFLAMLI